MLLFWPLTAATVWGQGQTAPQPRPAAEDAAIAGIVVNSHTGEPVKRAQITLTGGTGSDDAVTGITDGEGKFRMGGIAPGTYRVQVARSGFIRPHTRGVDAAREPATLTLQPKQLIGELVYRLAPGGILSGLVVDEDNTPMAEVRMQCLQYSYHRSGRQLTACGFTTTDDRGQYRISGLSPGHYYLKATYVDPINLMGTIRGGVPEGYPALYYPGVKDASQAGEITVQESEEKPGIDFKLAPSRAVHVQGQVRTSDGRLGGGALVSLAAPMSAGMSSRTPVRTGGDGAFRFEGVTAGSYMLSASLGGNRVTELLAVGEADLDNVRVFLSTRVDLRGHVRVEGDQKVSLSGLQLYLAPVDESVLMAAGAGMGSADADGNLTFHSVSVGGEYQVLIDNLPEDAYLEVGPDGQQLVRRPGGALHRRGGHAGTGGEHRRRPRGRQPDRRSAKARVEHGGGADSRWDQAHAPRPISDGDDRPVWTLHHPRRGAGRLQTVRVE